MRKLAIATLIVAGLALTGSAFAQSAAPAATPAPAAHASSHHHAKSSTHHKSHSQKGSGKDAMPATKQ